jgi:transcriptional antiterminator RfaH
MNNELKWHAVYTKPRAEKKLQEALSKIHIENYLPLISLKRKWSDRLKRIEKPLFDSYIFVRISFAQDSLRILKLPHSVAFVLSAGEPATISEDNMERLRISVDNFADSLTTHDATDFKAGDLVRIGSGPFAGKEGRVAKIAGKTMLIVNFPTLNKSLQIEIPVTDIETETGAILQR